MNQGNWGMKGEDVFPQVCVRIGVILLWIKSQCAVWHKATEYTTLSARTNVHVSVQITLWWVFCYGRCEEVDSSTIIFLISTELSFIYLFISEREFVLSVLQLLQESLQLSGNLYFQPPSSCAIVYPGKELTLSHWIAFVGTVKWTQEEKTQLFQNVCDLCFPL